MVSKLLAIKRGEKSVMYMVVILYSHGFAGK